MAVFGSTSYTKPGVYTQVIIEQAGQPLFGAARIPVVIGEGTQFFTTSNVELFRGSSSNTDDQAVNENISNQVTGLGRSFQTTYFPVVDGTGKGIVTNDPADIQVTSIDSDGNQIPVTVISLNGATGQFSTQNIVTSGTEIYLTYYFKRGDTPVVNEDESAQIPAFATQTVTGAAAGSPATAGSVVLSLHNPGAGGNLVTLQFVAGTAVPDSLAVSGAGTDAIVINITNSGTPNPRTLADLVPLISTGISTLDGSLLTAGSITGNSDATLQAGAAVPFAGGQGQATNTVFKTKFTPITDGTNGGVTTTNPADVKALVNGSPAVVTAVNGQEGLVTLAKPVSFGSTLAFTYNYNTWANTFDLLPASNVQSIVEVGLGPNRSDYVEDVDFTLGVDADGNGTIVWGPAVSEAIGVSAAGETANFTPQEVTASVVDEQVFLRPVSGTPNGKLTSFILQDTPTDGTGQAIVTDNPALVTIYVGDNPLEAFWNGPASNAPYQPVRVSGATQTVILKTAPPAGSGVWASYYRNVLETHEYTVEVVNPGYGGAGTFLIEDELNRVAPLVAFPSGQHIIDDAGFQATGIVYPNSHPDLQATAGAAVDETVTLTFNNDGATVVHPATVATLVASFGSSGSITFTATQGGVIGNGVQIALDAITPNSVPVVVNGNLVTIYANWNGTLATLAQIAAFFPSAETSDGGQILAGSVVNGSQTPSTTAAANLMGGVDQVTEAVTHSYTVSSTNTKGSGSGAGNVGYLNQTYVDVVTGFRITIVNPPDHASYGVPTIGTSYQFTHGDVLTFSVKADASGANAAIRACGTPGVLPAQFNNLIAIPGLHTTVISNFQSTAGDTVVLSTFRGSGDGPKVGEFYYVTFTTGKTAADYGLKIYTNPVAAYAAYGTPSTVNRLSLGIQFLTQNGAQTFAAIQVPVVPGTNQATSSDFIAAIQTLALALPGSDDQYVAGVIPLSTDPTVHQSLSRFLTTQAAPRIQAFGLGFVGYDQFTAPNQARQNAVALDSERMIAIGNAVAGVLITDPLTGVSVEYPVSGEFMAAGLAGLEFNPANDVATTLTNQNVTGFSRLLKVYDNPTMDQMAADGLTVLVSNQGALRCRHYKTTRPENPVYSEPTCTTVVDYTREAFEADMKQFIGRKLVDSLVSDITIVANARLKSEVNQEILTGYSNLSVQPDAVDPTTVNISVEIKPMFSLLWITVTFTVTTTL